MEQSYSYSRAGEHKIIRSIDLQTRLFTEGLDWKLAVDLVGISKGYLIKRAMDFCVAALFLIFISPVYLAIAIAIVLDSPGSVFFKETRMGLHGKTFEIWKFRSMQADAEKLLPGLESQNEMKDGVNFKMKDDPRITRIGKFLRRHSLDELPQAINVLRGEMSLIGPRPFNMRDVGNFAKHHFFRYEVLPGITGLWQVSGRSDIVYFDRVIELDIDYIENWSLWMDLGILLKTVKVVFSKEGAY
jgi:exopolysaccharide biosynthesis polyprenyl glycosylphosphotransferase